MRFKTPAFETFETLSKTYGPVFTLWLGRSPNLIISDPEIAQLLMGTRGAKHSSRPHSFIYGDVFDENTNVGFIPDNAVWAQQRRLMQGTFDRKSVEGYRERMEAEASKLVGELLEDGEGGKEGKGKGELGGWSGSFQRFASSVVFSIAYGFVLPPSPLHLTAVW